MKQGLWEYAVDLCVLPRASLTMESVASFCQEDHRRISGQQESSVNGNASCMPPLDLRIKIPLVFLFLVLKGASSHMGFTRISKQQIAMTGKISQRQESKDINTETQAMFHPGSEAPPLPKFLLWFQMRGHCSLSFLREAIYLTSGPLPD